MPIHDHFHPPWSIQRPWKGFYLAWAAAIAFHLNSAILPAKYFALPVLEVRGQVEVDFEVQVQHSFDGPKLVAAIELVSPANKDRASARHAFATMCANHLRRGVSVIVIDIVTERNAKLHAEIMNALERIEEPPWESPSHLYAVSYRGVLAAEHSRVEAWPHVLNVGAPLPELPMWLEIDLCLPLRLEESYTSTCGSLRMRG
jgi:hypothetical protein